MRKVRVYLVGVGGYGSLYAEALLRRQQAGFVEIVGATDPHGEAVSARELKTAGVPFYENMHDFYSRQSADLCIISTPIYCHREHVSIALQYGSNVLCEKPAAGSTEEVEEMIQKQQRSGKFVAIGFQRSFSDAVLKMKQDILSGNWGAPQSLKTITMFPRPINYFSLRSWAGKRYTIDGKPVMDSIANNAAAHMLHHMLFCLGRQLDTSAIGTLEEAELYRANEIETFDTVCARFSVNGIPVNYYAAHPVEKEVRPTFEFHFENGLIRMGADQRITGIYRNGMEISYGKEEGHEIKLDKVLTAIQTGDRSLVTCTVETAYPHSLAVKKLDEKLEDVYIFQAAEKKRFIMRDGTEQWMVPGLGKRLQAAYEKEKMLKELDG